MNKVSIFLALITILTGCVHMTPAQHETYLEMIAKGEPTTGYPIPVLSGMMSLFPGGGQFFNGQVKLGVINMLLWPLSCLWSIPSAIVDARTIRRINSVERYLRRERVKKRLRRERFD